MYKDNPNLVDHLREEVPCLSHLTEMKQNYQKPNLKKPPVTRASRYEQFLWREFYDEYIRSKQRLESVRPGTPTTEYYDEFTKPHLGAEHNIASEELVNQYPLYATNAVTYWNPSGDFTCNFKRSMNISLPVELQPGKFNEKNIF